jgi:hypothetical protein
MRLLLWTAMVCVCAVNGGELAVLLATFALLGCASDQGLTRRRARIGSGPIGG